VSLATEKEFSRQFFNVPNQLTTLRLILAVVLFAIIPQGYPLLATILFMIAAGTDWIDGYWARKYGQVTTVGRIFDPFVDKIIICGTFIYLVAYPQTGVMAWMAVVVVAREMLVTALRSFLEGEGADFSAKMSGKLKMALQCLAATLGLYSLTYSAAPPEWFATALRVSIWAAIVLTVYSGAEYLLRAWHVLRRARS